ncbi:MAG: hypothetical protein CMC15_14970, partial [Flavobacteriaceae bacterium]|nr:hypothetical protein [Flavobacteriaceae bacterium]
MAHKFIIDDRTGALYSDFTARRVTSAAELLQAERGLTPTFEIYSINVATDTRAVTGKTLTNGNLSVSIGLAGKAPDKGLIKAAWSGTSYESAYLNIENLTASALASAFNNSITTVSNAGGLMVDELGEGKWLLTMKKVGAITGDPSLNIESSDPPSAVEINEIRTGDSDTKAQWIINLIQSPVANIATGSWSSATSGSYSGLSSTISLNTTAMLSAIARGQRDFEISIIHSGQVLHRSSVSIHESLDPTAAGSIVVTSPTLFTLGSNAVNQGETIAISGGLTYDGTTLAAPFLPLAGGTMTGAVAMGSQKITGLADGTASGDAINKGQLDGLIDNAPEALNTLNELAAALGDDVNFSTTVANNIATKLPLAGGTMTGAILHADGSAAAPSMSFSSSNDTGFYHYGADTIGISTGGNYRAKFGSDGLFETWAGIQLKGGVVKTTDGDASGPGYSFEGDPNSGMFRADADKLGFSVGGSEKMRLTSSGLGVGTTSPNFLIDCEGAGGGLRVYNTTTDGDTEIHIRNTGTTAEGRILFGDSGDTDIGKIVYDHGGNDLIFTTNATEAARFNSSGRLVLGGTTAGNVLDVQTGTSDEGIRLTSTGSGGRTVLQAMVNNVANGNANLNLYHATALTTRITSDPSNPTFFNSGPVNFGADGDGKDVTFYGATSGSYMLWDESADDLILGGAARLGIGCTDPDASLEINAASAPDIFLRTSGTNPSECGRIRFCEATNLFQGGFVHYDGSANTLNIGVHHTSDETIGNDINAISIARADGAVTVGSDGSGHDFSLFHSATAGRSVVWDASAGKLELADDVTLKMGTDGDLQAYEYADDFYFAHYNLDVNHIHYTNDKDFIWSTRTSNANAEILRLDASARSINVPDDVKLKLGSDTDMEIYHGSGNNWINCPAGGNLMIQSNGLSLRSTAQENYVNCTANGSVSLYYDNSNVVSTTSAGMTVSGSSGDGVVSITNSANSQTLRLDQNSIRTSTNNNLTFLTNGNTNSLVLEQANNRVGIGTSSPLAPIHIQGTALSGFESGDVATDTMAIIENDDNARLAIVAGTISDLFFGDADDIDAGRVRYYHSNNQMAFFTGGTERARLTSTGFGIGTDSPQALVDIAGSHDGATAEWQNLAIGSDAAGWIDTNDGIGRIDFYGRHTHGTGGTLEVGASIVALADANWNGGAGTAYGRLEFMTADGGAPT